MKIIKKLFLISFLSFAFSASLFAYPADVQDISSDQYFETALNEINSAKTSVEVVMYVISVFPDQPGSRPSQLVDALM